MSDDDTLDHLPIDVEQDSDDDVIMLPWWQNPLNIVAIALVVGALAGILGFSLGRSSATLNDNEVDVGFLQDMAVHHEQAVTMALIYLDKADASPSLQLLAREIVVSQNIEKGQMIELLYQMDQPLAAPTDIAMAWMGEPIDIDRMAGMATEDDLVRLIEASGPEADELFVDLMVAHHEGGIHMASYATTHADNDEIRSFAESINLGQASEITEIQAWLADIQG